MVISDSRLEVARELSIEALHKMLDLKEKIDLLNNVNSELAPSEEEAQKEVDEYHAQFDKAMRQNFEYLQAYGYELGLLLYFLENFKLNPEFSPKDTNQTNPNSFVKENY